MIVFFRNLKDIQVSSEPRGKHSGLQPVAVIKAQLNVFRYDITRFAAVGFWRDGSHNFLAPI
jgi:hypothetical protein